MSGAVLLLAYMPYGGQRDTCTVTFIHVVEIQCSFMSLSAIRVVKCKMFTGLNV